MPPSIAMVIDVETDNKLRALQDLRHEIKRHGGTVTPTSYLFKRRGRVQFQKDERGLGVDEILDEAIEAGADDVEADDDGNIVVWTDPSETIGTARSLAASLKLTVESSDILWDPNVDTLVQLDSQDALTSLKNLVNALQDDQSVQGIYVNITKGEVSDEAWADLQEKIPV
jgi:transcriptional/translational regulatory protein YebC/TACO1